MDALVGELLASSRVQFEALNLRDVDVKDAASRAVERASTAAPRAIKSSIILGCRRAAAHIKADCPPQLSRASTVAPWSSKSFAASTLPVLATAMSAVWPSAFGESASAPASSSSLKISVSATSAASPMGVAP